MSDNVCNRGRAVLHSAAAVALFGLVASTTVARASLIFTNQNIGQVRSVYASNGTIYAGTIQSGNGLLISQDGGATWTQHDHNNGFGPGTTLFDSVYDVYENSGIIYAATDGGLITSDDGGGTWTVNGGLGSVSLRSVHVSGGTIYAGTYDGGLRVSSDNGSTRATYTTGDGLAHNRVNDVYGSGSTIYAATPSGLSISNDGGDTWNSASAIGSTAVNGLSVSGSTIYCALNSSVRVSADSGSTWTTYQTNGILNPNGPGPYLQGIYESGGVIYAAGQSGASISTDGGVTWTNYTSADGLGSYGRSIFVSGGNIYVGTDGGLSIASFASVPGSGIAGLATIGLAGASRRRRR